jgi:hypothetical protein
MEKEVKAGINGCIVNNLYMDGFAERVYYAGMPSKDAFSLIFEEVEFEEHNEYKIKDQKQLYFPIDYNEEISFPSTREPCKFRVQKVSPTSLSAIVIKKD